MIQLRRDTAANWTTANPVLGSGQPGIETDTGKWKVGDGVTAWASLAYMAGSTGGVTDGDKGDITVTGGGAVWSLDAGVVDTAQLAANAVTNAKLDVMAANTVKANNTVSSNTPVNVALASEELLGRGVSGNITGIALGTNLSMTANTLHAASGAAWGGITGTLSAQTDLQAALDAKQPLDADLTTIAGLTATTDNFLQAKVGAWASRTIAQVKTDLGLTGTNSGDQTITLTGPVTGSGTGSFATSITAGAVGTPELAANAVTNAKLDVMAANTIKANNTVSSNTPVNVAIASQELVGRGVSGNITGIALGTNLSMSGNTLNASGGGSVAWGAITGTLSAQTDLQAALDAKASLTGTETLTNKTLGITNTFVIKDTLLTIQDDADATKQIQFDLSGLPTATTRTYSFSSTGGGTFAIQGGGTNVFTGSNTFNDTALIVRDDADTTKKFQFQASGITTGTTRTLTVPNADGTLVIGGGTASGTNTGDQTITLTGPITGSGTGSFATTITANAVALSHMAQVATATFLGRTTAGTGNVEALTATQATALLNNATTTTKGLVPAPGTALGLFLKDDMTWAAATGGGSTFMDSTFAVQNTTDVTKQLKFDVSGVSTLSTRTMTVPDVSGTLVLTAATQTLTNKSIAATQLTGALQAAQFPALTGPITTTAGSLATSITAGAVGTTELAANAVTNAKLDVMAANTIKANNTVSSNTPVNVAIASQELVGRGVSGNITGIALGTNLSMSGNTLNAAGGSGAPGGSTTQVQYNNAGAFAGAGEVQVESGQLRLLTTTTFTAPASGGIRLISLAQTSNTAVPAYIGQGGDPHPLQMDITQDDVQIWKAIPNSTTVSTMGIPAPTAVGTATTLAPSATNIYTQTNGVEYLVTTASTTAVAGFRGTQGMLTVGGSAAGLGGFRFFGRFGMATGTANATRRFAFGVRALTSAPTDVNPSTLVSCCFFGYDAGDTNMQFMSNDASGTCTKVDLGANFPRPSADRTKSFDCWLFSPPGTTATIYWRIVDRATLNEASGNTSVSTDLPATSARLSPFGFSSVGGTSSVTGLCLHSMQCQPIVIN